MAGAPGGSTAWLILGFADLSAPFKGGVLVPDPSPPSLILPLPTDGLGGVDLTFPWFDGAPAGLGTWWQAWIPDASGPFGYVATNAVLGTTP